MTYELHERKDGSLMTVRTEGLSISVGKFLKVLTQAEFEELTVKLATHDMKFDTVEQRLIATPRETKR